jgi:hypothetical protein
LSYDNEEQLAVFIPRRPGDYSDVLGRGERDFVELGLPFRRGAFKRRLDHRHFVAVGVGYLIGDLAVSIKHRDKLWREYQYSGLGGLVERRRMTDGLSETLRVISQRRVDRV